MLLIPSVGLYALHAPVSQERPRDAVYALEHCVRMQMQVCVPHRSQYTLRDLHGGSHALQYRSPHVYMPRLKSRRPCCS
jgi:hypothetical protein